MKLFENVKKLFGIHDDDALTRKEMDIQRLAFKSILHDFNDEHEEARRTEQQIKTKYHTTI